MGIEVKEIKSVNTSGHGHEGHVHSDHPAGDKTHGPRTLHSLGAEKIHDREKEAFPLPFLLVFIGYALILTIDKVAFDSHSLHHHDHGHD